MQVLRELCGIFIPGLIILFAWGWIALGLIGVLRLVTIRGSAHQIRRIVIAICLIALAIFWQQVTQPLNFGVEYGHIRTRAGDIEAFVRERGFDKCFLVIRRKASQRELFVSRVPPESIFWIQEGKTIGVANRDQHLIVDIEILFDPTINSRKLSSEEERRLDYERKLTPDEERRFEAARLAVAES